MIRAEMAASCAASASDCTAISSLSVQASLRSTGRTPLPWSPLKQPIPLKRKSQKMQLSVAMATQHYYVEKVSGAELNKLLAPDREKPMVVDFYAAWCGPCVILAQEIERLAVEFKHKVRFVKIDTDDEYQLAHKMQVRGLPTVFFVSKDPEKNVIRAEGILPREVYRSIIQNELL